MDKDGEQEVAIPVRHDRLSPESVTEVFIHPDDAIASQGHVEYHTLDATAQAMDSGRYGSLFYVFDVFNSEGFECPNNEVFASEQRAEQYARRISEGEYAFNRDLQRGDLIPRAVIYEPEVVAESGADRQRRNEREQARKQRQDQREREAEWREKRREERETDLREAYIGADGSGDIPQPMIDERVRAGVRSSNRRVAVILGLLAIGHVGLAVWFYTTGDVLVAVFDIALFGFLVAMAVVYYGRSKTGKDA